MIRIFFAPMSPVNNPNLPLKWKIYWVNTNELPSLYTNEISIALAYECRTNEIQFKKIINKIQHYFEDVRKKKSNICRTSQKYHEVFLENFLLYSHGENHIERCGLV